MVRRVLAAVAALLLSTTATAAWQEASSRHFVVYSDDTPDNVKAYTARLERFDKAVRVLRGIPEDQRGPAGRVTVYVVANVDEITKLIGSQANAAGFYQARAEGSVAFIPRHGSGDDQLALKPEQIMLHEYTHHIMYNDWPTAVFPKWFSEGFAEFHSTAIFNRDGSVTFGAQPLSRMYGAVRDPRINGQLTMHDMLLGDSSKFDDVATYSLYSRGWLLTHYLTFDADRRKQLAQYIDAITHGRPNAQAVKLLGNPDQLDGKLDGYIRRRDFPAITIAASDLATGEIAVRAVSPGEAAIIPARIRSANGVDPKRAQPVAALARTAAAPFATDAAAQNELAEAEYDAGNFAASEAAADRALAADPKSVHARIYKGMALQAAAEKAKVADPATWTTIRRWFGAANKLETENPWPLILYYDSFAAQKLTPTKNAEDGLLYAYALAPFALDLRMKAARVYLGRGEAEPAREAMLPVAFSERGGDYRTRVRDTLAALDSGGPAAALAALKKADDEAEAKQKKAQAG